MADDFIGPVPSAPPPGMGAQDYGRLNESQRRQAWSDYERFQALVNPEQPRPTPQANAPEPTPFDVLANFRKAYQDRLQYSPSRNPTFEDRLTQSHLDEMMAVNQHVMDVQDNRERNPSGVPWAVPKDPRTTGPAAAATAPARPFVQQLRTMNVPSPGYVPGFRANTSTPAPAHETPPPPPGRRPALPPAASKRPPLPAGTPAWRPPGGSIEVAPSPPAGAKAQNRVRSWTADPEHTA